MRFFGLSGIGAAKPTSVHDRTSERLPAMSAGITSGWPRAHSRPFPNPLRFSRVTAPMCSFYRISGREARLALAAAPPVRGLGAYSVEPCTSDRSRRELQRPYRRMARRMDRPGSWPVGQTCRQDSGGSGHVTTYSCTATHIGNPRAARAVGP